MKPVTQKVTDGVNGDCFGACVASILELGDNYPNFHRKDRGPWMDQWNDFLQPLNLELLYIPGGHPPPNGYAIMSVKSVNFPGVQHSVVWHGDGRGGGSIVYDPSPLKKAEEADPIGWFAFGVLDPIKKEDTRWEP